MAESVYLSNPFGGGGGAGTPGGSSTQIQYNNGGSFGGVSGLTWDGTDLQQARTTTIVQTPGTVASGNTSMTLFQMLTPASAENTAPFELYLSGATFAGKWNPVLYFGYNASAADTTEPVMRQVIEGLYSHGVDDVEMYWEYTSTDRASLQRPIFFFRERDGTSHGLVFNTDGISFAPRDGNTSTIQDLNYTFYGNEANFRSASRGISMWAGSINSDAGFRLYASPYPNTDYSGATIIRASADSAGASVNTAAFAVSLMTNAEARLVVRADGKIALNFNDDFTNYERYTFAPTSGLMTFTAESAGTGAANMSIRFVPKGTGTVSFGTHSALGAETVTGYITITDAGGTTRKLAVVS